MLPARGDRTGAPSALAPLERPAEARSLVGGAFREALGLPRDPRAALEDRGFAVVWAERQAAALESLAAGDPQPRDERRRVRGRRRSESFERTRGILSRTRGTLSWTL